MHILQGNTEMKARLFFVIIGVFVLFNNYCEGYKILAIFPSNGRSHHIIFSSFVEELAARNHVITVINYFPVKKMPNLRQISLQGENESTCNNINMEGNLKSIPASFFVDFYRAYDMAVAFQEMGNDNCERLMTNADIRKLITSGGKFDLIIAEQFVTDCGLAIAYKLNAPVVGMTAHIMMPWTYSRLGAPNNPVFVPNHLFASGSKPSLWQKFKSTIINLSMNAYYRFFIQSSDQEIVNKVYPEVPDLEVLGNNISLVMLNQYFPLSGSRLHGANIVEVGGMHVRDSKINDKELQDFLDTAENNVVYISFGTVAYNFPTEILQEIMTFIKNTNMKFVWKVDNVVGKPVPKNLLMRKWLPQPAILCHPNVVAFVSHSGMLSTTEAVHCGVPLISVPLFGDQFSNAAAASENGLAVVLDIYTLKSELLEKALDTVLQDRFQMRAKEFSIVWKDRPLSAMDTAVFWVEYVARHQGTVNMRPPTVNLNTFEYLMIDILLAAIAIVLVTIYVMTKLFCVVYTSCRTLPNKLHKTRKTE